MALLTVAIRQLKQKGVFLEQADTSKRCHLWFLLPVASCFALLSGCFFLNVNVSFSPHLLYCTVLYHRDRDEVNRLERERAKLERERRERERLEHERETERLKIEKLRLEEQKRALKRSLEEEAASVASFKQSSSSARYDNKLVYYLGNNYGINFYRRYLGF